MPERTYRTLLWTLALTGLLLDQVSKYGVFAWLEKMPDNAYAVFQSPDTTGFHLVAQLERDSHGRLLYDGSGRTIPHVNHGALFGFLRDHKTLANSGFAVISLLAALAIVYWSAHKSTARDRWLCSALGLILAGTLGNFYDRVMFNGVRDFLHWSYLFDWPVFNLADCCLVCGAALLLIQAFFSPQTGADGPANEEQTATLTHAPQLTGAPK